MSEGAMGQRARSRTDQPPVRCRWIMGEGATHWHCDAPLLQRKAGIIGEGIWECERGHIQ